MISSDPNFPRVVSANDLIEVDLRSGDLEEAREIVVRSVIDESSFGDLQGIEILNLLDQIGANALSAWSDDNRPFSYDPDADAFYVRIDASRSPRQRSTDAHLYLDRRGLFRVVVPNA